jgi:ribosomal protein L29
MSKLAQSLRDQSLEELEASLFETSKELFKLRNELSLNKKLDKPHLLQALRKKRARTLTILKEKGRDGR